MNCDEVLCIALRECRPERQVKREPVILGRQMRSDLSEMRRALEERKVITRAKSS